MEEYPLILRASHRLLWCGFCSLHCHRCPAGPVDPDFAVSPVEVSAACAGLGEVPLERTC